mmetsp:Transcript_9714/g.13190  ORF Transcript_9714/g.13190 Transcript_9714/m.13190 type:complete len:147 (+) Transcript_9714:367-807(+)
MNMEVALTDAAAQVIQASVRRWRTRRYLLLQVRKEFEEIFQDLESNTGMEVTWTSKNLCPPTVAPIAVRKPEMISRYETTSRAGSDLIPHLPQESVAGQSGALAVDSRSREEIEQELAWAEEALRSRKQHLRRHRKTKNEMNVSNS